VSNINLYNFTRRVPCGVSLSTFELIPAVATAQPGALVTIGAEYGSFPYRSVTVGGEYGLHSLQFGDRIKMYIN